MTTTFDQTSILDRTPSRARVGKSADYRVPEAGQFVNDAEAQIDWLPAPGLERIAAALVESEPLKLQVHERYKVVYLWKRKGGRSKGQAVFGKCLKPSGIATHWTDADFVIWLAADNVTEAEYGPVQIEAVLYHEMLHVDEQQANEDDEPTPALRGHTFEGFAEEITRYGLWSPEAEAIARPIVALQLSLPMGGER